jgi:hypothetical protein
MPAVTYEGDNTVMMQQASRFLLKMVKNSLAGKFDKITAPFEYLRRFQEVISSEASFSGSFGLAEVHDLMARNTICSVKTVVDLLSSAKN